jgi:hypothetical protein
MVELMRYLLRGTDLRGKEGPNTSERKAKSSPVRGTRACVETGLSVCVFVGAALVGHRLSC